MKIRNGFISNSSTSSFVVIGIKLPRDFQLDMMKFGTKVLKLTGLDECEYPEDKVYDCLNNADWMYETENDPRILGKCLLQFSNDGGDDVAAFDVKELKDTMAFVEQTLDGLIPEETKVQLLAGTVYS